MVAQRKINMTRGNQFGLKPGDRIILSEHPNGAISDSAWMSQTKTHKGTIVGYDQYGYPLVCLDQNHPKVLHVLAKMAALGCKIDNNTFAKLPHNSSCVSVYAESAFRQLDVNGNPIRRKTPAINYNLTIGEAVTVFEEHGKINDSNVSGTPVHGTIIGCQESGAPLVLLSAEHAHAGLGWPLKNLLDENGQPRCSSTISKAIRDQLFAEPNHAERRCYYIHHEAAFIRTFERSAKDSSMKDPIRKNFDLDYGDRIRITCDEDGIDFEFTEEHERVEATVVGFRTEDGSPIVLLDREIAESGWPIKDCLTINKSGLPVSGSSFSIDTVLISKHQDKLAGDYAYYIGNAEAFKKITKKKGKSKTMATDDSNKSGSEKSENKVLARVKKSAAKVPYRMARMQAVTNGKNAVLNAFKDRLEPNSFAMLEGFLSSDVGQGSLLGLIGLLGPMLPKVGEDPRVQALCEEFLDEGVAKGANEAMNFAMAILAPALMSAVAALPPVAEAVEARAASKTKKRIAAPEEAKEIAEVEEEEDDEEEAASSGRRTAT